MSSPLNFACENSQSTNAAIADDFLGGGRGGGGVHDDCLVPQISKTPSIFESFTFGSTVILNLKDCAARVWFETTSMIARNEV